MPFNIVCEFTLQNWHKQFWCSCLCSFMKSIYAWCLCTFLHSMQLLCYCTILLAQQTVDCSYQVIELGFYEAAGELDDTAVAVDEHVACDA